MWLLVITQCSMQHLRPSSSTPSTSSSSFQPALSLAKTFERRKCNHWETKSTDGECISGIVGDDNRYKYCVATQSAVTRAALRKVPGVPLLFVKRSVVLLEPPSDASVGRRHEVSSFSAY